MLKLLFVTDVDLAGESGSNVATRSMIGALASRPGLEVTLLSPAPGGDAGSPTGGPGSDSNLARWDPLPERTASSPWWHLRATVAARERCRILLEELCPDLVVVRYAPFFILASRFFPVAGAELVMLVRGTPSMGRQGLAEAVLAGCNRWIGRETLRRADRRLFAFRESAEAFGYEAEGAGCEIVPNAADLEVIPEMSRADARELLRVHTGLALDGRVIGFVGSVRARHRLDELLLASAALHERRVDHRLLVVGSGSRIPRLRRLARELGIEEDVIFTGRVPHRDVGTYLCAADLMYSVVDPTRPSNPIKVYEALAAGRPVVTTRTRELEFVVDEGFGVVLEDDADEGAEKGERLADVLQRGLELSWGDQKASAARAYIARHHTWDSVADAILRGHEHRSSRRAEAPGGADRCGGAEVG